MEFTSYITGFTDGEGSFSVSFNYREKFRTHIEVRPSFSLSQNRRSLSVLQKIREYFGCGGIRFNRGDNTYKYEVRSVPELVRSIIPHFQQYPLFTAKQRDFEKFCEITEMIHKNYHKNPEYLRKIIDLAYEMNESGKRHIPKKTLLHLLDKMKI